MKICSNPKCQHKGKMQPLSNFWKNYKNPDGLQYHCIDCMKIYQKKWRKENPELNLLVVKRWAEANPDKVKVIQTRYSKTDGCKKKQKKYNQSEKGKATKKKYQQSEKYIEYIQSERAKEVRRKYKERTYIPHPRTIKPHFCKLCGEDNPENFHKGQRTRCKKCRIEIEIERQKQKRFIFYIAFINLKIKKNVI